MASSFSFSLPRGMVKMKASSADVRMRVLDLLSSLA